jgi:hypothetical protein
LEQGRDCVTTLNSFEDITNGRLRRYGDFPNQTFFGFIADEVKRKSEKQAVKQRTNSTDAA